MPDTATPRRIPFRLFEALASLQLAVLSMIALALACAVATFYESKHGTAAAQRDFYQTGWFTLILATLAANIFASMMRRYPWTRHHAGFVMAHLGILAILGGSLVTLHAGLDGSMALYEGETTDRVSLQDRALFVALPGHSAHGTFAAGFEKRPPGPGREQRFPILGSGATLVAEEYAPHVRVTETLEEGAVGSPALHFVLDSAYAKQDAWLVASDPERAHLGFGPVVVSLHGASTEAEARELARHAAGQNEVSFVLGPDGKLLYGIETSKGPGPAGRVEIGRPIETPWMGMKVVVDRVIAKAVTRREVSPAVPPEKEERRTPAVKVRLEGAGGPSGSEWLLWSESRSLAFAGGEATVAFRPSEVAVPFRVTLLAFSSEKYPGSSMPATYESTVRVEDPERGVFERLISMNNPLHYRGYVFFQASYVEGTPMMSVFSVARAPGLPLVYLGTTLLSLGVVWMFYLKPYLARRQGQQALSARHERANGPSGLAEPVRGPA